MAQKERKGGGLTCAAWMVEAARVSSVAVVDTMEPNNLLTLATATQQGGRRELEDGSWARERTVR
jgi:hypothetical protein